mmetsp:Transcript_15858/g.29935  ORF Transcript_15858/g.29935 Transcript_15858/m.29935 type:complete len:80 (-) Transcript_15858:508-747(-)
MGKNDVDLHDCTSSVIMPSSWLFIRPSVAAAAATGAVSLDCNSSSSSPAGDAPITRMATATSITTVRRGEGIEMSLLSC